MITYVEGDATYPQGEGTKLIVHCCNDIGAWGAGFVLALSKRWSEPEWHYKRSHLFLGDTQFVEVEDMAEDIVVCNLIGQVGVRDRRTVSPAKMLPRPPVRYDAIYDGLVAANQWAASNDATIHMPRMGAGLAGGSWDVIEAIIKEVVTVPVTVYDLPINR